VRGHPGHPPAPARGVPQVRMPGGVLVVPPSVSGSISSVSTEKSKRKESTDMSERLRGGVGDPEGLAWRKVWLWLKLEDIEKRLPWSVDQREVVTVPYCSFSMGEQAVCFARLFPSTRKERQRREEGKESSELFCKA